MPVQSTTEVHNDSSTVGLSLSPTSCSYMNPPRSLYWLRAQRNRTTWPKTRHFRRYIRSIPHNPALFQPVTLPSHPRSNRFAYISSRGSNRPTLSARPDRHRTSSSCKRSFPPSYGRRLCQTDQRPEARPQSHRLEASQIQRSFFLFPPPFFFAFHYRRSSGTPFIFFVSFE